MKPKKTSFLEPLIERRRIFWVEVLLGAVIILGLYIISQFAFHYYLGILYALFSAFLASLFGVLNKQFVKKHSPIAISLYEMSAGFVCIFFAHEVLYMFLCSFHSFGTEKEVDYFQSVMFFSG